MPPSFRMTVVPILLGCIFAVAKLTVAQETPPFKASFDCMKAASPIENLICSDETLANLDREMMALFTATRNAIENEEARQGQLQEQRAWLKARLTTCKIPSSGKLPDDTSVLRACLTDELHKRNSVLSEAIKKKPSRETVEAVPFDSARAVTDKELKIVRISPTGDDVEQRQQIVLQFNRPVVPIGRMDREASEIPVEILPAVNCHWHWLNRSALACNLDENDLMTLATRYRVRVNPGIRDEDGMTIAKVMEHTFLTARPKVVNSHSEYWSGASLVRGWDKPGVPIIDVRFNQQVAKRSVADALFIEANGKQYPLEVSPAPSFASSDRVLFVSLDKRQFLIKDTRKVKDEPVAFADATEEARLNWDVKPKTELPEDTEYSLRVRPGLRSAFGPERGIEDRLVVKGATFPPFVFLGFSCTGNDDKEIFNKFGNTGEPCSITSPVSLGFSAPLLGKQFVYPDLITPPMAYRKSPLNPLDRLENSGSADGTKHKKGEHYNISLPMALKSRTEYTINLKGGIQGNQTTGPIIQDLFGRTLPANVMASFLTDQYRPTLEWSGQTSVLEKAIPSDVSLYSANIEQANLEGQALFADGELRSINHDITFAGKPDQFVRSIFGVRKMFVSNSGLFAGKIRLKPETAHVEGGTAFSAQVTPFHVHAKIGTYSSLVWVTDLATGKPVTNAEVSLREGSVFESDPVKNKELATARTTSEGLALFIGDGNPHRDAIIKGHVSILVRKDKDMAYLPLSSDEFHRYRSGEDYYAETMTAWGTTAEGVYKPGAEVQYKLFVRNMRTEGASIPEQKSFKLEILDPKGSVIETRDITLSEFGSFAGAFMTGKNGLAGRYRLTLRSEKPYLHLDALDFLVTDYVPASFKVQTTLNGPTYMFRDEVVVDTLATLQSGGPFTGAGNRYTATLIGKPFTSSHPASKDFVFKSPWCRPSRGCGKVSLFNATEQLNQEGKAAARFTADGTDIGFGTLEVESAVEDDRGKNVANMATARYFGVDRFVGLKMEGFELIAGKAKKFQFVVTDVDGKLVEGVKVRVSSSGTRTTSFRVKGAGNNFITRSSAEETKEKDGDRELLSGKTAGEFEMVFNSVGKNTLTVSIEDTQGKTHFTEIWLWVTGPEAISWENKNDGDLDLVVEKTRYNVGETVNVLIKNPYPKSKALVTIERLGIVKSWVEDLDNSLPKLSFQVTEDMVPNFSLSVVVFSPRIDTRQTDEAFDMGKPEWRMGYAQMEAVGTKHSLHFEIKTDQSTYRPGQEVQVEVSVAPKDGAKVEKMELAVAVLDEAVFDLVKGGMSYFDPQKGFYGTRIDDVKNFNILRRLVTHAPPEPVMKGDDPGGDGGISDKMRSNLKSLAFWNPTLITDEKGKAKFSFKAPDNLTGWRILVVATDAKDHLGVGFNGFKVNRLTEIQPAMPNQVVEGDTFVAAFTVMNRTPKTRKITMQITAEGTLATNNPSMNEVVEVDPFQRKMVKFKLTAGKVPNDRMIEKGLIAFKVTAGDDSDRDGLTHQLLVNKRKNLDIGANYGTTTEGAVQETLVFPENIRTDVGDVSVSLSPTIIGDLEGAFRFMKQYPYECWEQKLSRAVMAASYQSLKQYLAADFVWEGTSGVIAEVLNTAKDFQAANGGMGYFKPENERADPYLSAYTALCFAMLDNLGFKPPKPVEDRLVAYLQEMLRTDVMPTFYTKGMASSVRAVALSALSRMGKVDEDMLKRHYSHIEQMDMFGKAQMLAAAIRIGKQDEMVQTITDKILGSSNETGGRIVFSERLDDGYNRMLSSVARTNCAVLSSLMLVADSQKGTEVLQDIPFRLARTIRTMRGQRDHFENPQENMFCMNGLVDYARRYEKVEPAMDVSVKFDGDNLEKTHQFKSFTDKPFVASRPIDISDPGSHKTVSIVKKGEGRLYYATIMRYATNQDQERNVTAGVEIEREYSVENKATGEWRLLAREDRVKRGDVVRVDLFLRLPAARVQIVVDDPIPGGLEPVNQELATASQVDAQKAVARFAGASFWMRFADWQEYNYSFWSFSHKELRHETARFFAEYLPPGNYHLSYTTQAVAEGDFLTQPVFAGEMYDADIYGKGISGTLHVDP